MTATFWIFRLRHSLPKRVQKVKCRAVIIDFAQVVSIDSSAFSELNGLAQILQSKQITLICSGPLNMSKVPKMHYPMISGYRWYWQMVFLIFQVLDIKLRNIDHSYLSRAFGNLKNQGVLSLWLVHIRAISPFHEPTPVSTAFHRFSAMQILQLLVLSKRLGTKWKLCLCLTVVLNDSKCQWPFVVVVVASGEMSHPVLSCLRLVTLLSWQQLFIFSAPWTSKICKLFLISWKKTLPQFPAHEIPDKDMDAAVRHVEQLALSSQNLLQTVSVSSWPAGSKAQRVVADEAGNFCNRCDSEGLWFRVQKGRYFYIVSW